ncbi:hypothetical protein RIF29_29902 [Crotalaria pallida]|uniref:Uncharacterized protein n=1 Tax=Crotalaria pallida TaxID=3830 RepID=A0AAN9EFM0_CROPI
MKLSRILSSWRLIISGSNNKEFPYVTSSKNSKSEDQLHGGKVRRSKKGIKTPHRNSLGLTGCTESKASG